MIRSMTGYGRSQQTIDGFNITLEIKSVNHRYFEFSTRLARNYNFLEEKLKSFFSGTISRGKVECSVMRGTVLTYQSGTVKTQHHRQPQLSSAVPLHSEAR